MTYWHQREITNRLRADRAERRIERHSEIDDLLEQLPPHLAANYLRGSATE